KVDPASIIYSNFATTNLEFNGGDRYANKENLDPEKMQEWWAKERSKLLAVTSLSNTNMFQFDVSRGFPNIINKDSKNGVVEVSLVREKDLDKPIITIATEGNIAIMGAFNEDGEGITSANTGVNIPLGYPMLNFGGN